jgi:hypothetical protein
LYALQRRQFETHFRLVGAQVLQADFLAAAWVRNLLILRGFFHDFSIAGHSFNCPISFC